MLKFKEVYEGLKKLKDGMSIDNWNEFVEVIEEFIEEHTARWPEEQWKKLSLMLWSPYEDIKRAIKRYVEDVGMLNVENVIEELEDEGYQIDGDRAGTYISRPRHRRDEK